MSVSLRRYRVLHAVGKGAFGTVYRAQMVGERGFHKEVALKLINADVEDADEIARRQRDEARLLGLIRHRAILQVDGLVRLNGTWAVVMEYIDGANLSEVLGRGPFPPSCALQVVSEVAGALAIAWDAVGPDGEALNIIHRDIKPANIQVTRAGEVKLLDFGVARAKFDAREAETVGMLLGTLRYMAPERLDGLDSPAGDIYALGVVLAELLSAKKMPKTSSNPKRHEAARATMIAILEESGEAGHRELVGLVRDCLAYDPKERPTAKQLERRAWGLAQDFSVPRLREWAAVRVADVQERLRAKREEDGLSGEILSEQSESMMLDRSGASSRFLFEGSESRTLVAKRATAVAAVAGVFSIVLGIACAGVTVYQIAPMLDRQNVAPPVASPIPEVETGPDRSPGRGEEGVGVEPEIVEVEVIREVPVRVPETPNPTAPTPKPDPEPEPETTGRVVVKGDTGGVAVAGPSGTYAVPSKVPPGTYDVVFHDVVVLSGVQVRQGKSTVISCSEAFSRCTKE